MVDTPSHLWIGEDRINRRLCCSTHNGPGPIRKELKIPHRPNNRRDRCGYFNSQLERVSI